MKCTQPKSENVPRTSCQDFSKVVMSQLYTLKPPRGCGCKNMSTAEARHSGKTGLFQRRALNRQIYSGARHTTTNRKTQLQKAESTTLTSTGKGSYVLPLNISADWMDALSVFLTGRRYTVPMSVIINPATFLPRPALLCL